MLQTVEAIETDVLETGTIQLEDRPERKEASNKLCLASA